MAISISTEMADVIATAVAAALDDGYLRPYSGTRAATANTAIGAQVKLAELRYSDPAADDVTDGVVTFDAFTADDDADATGTATWVRSLADDGTTTIYDADMGEAASDFIIDNADIEAGGVVEVA